MSEQPPLVRQWILLRMLSAHHYGVAVKEVAEELGVSEKTVRRDLRTFQEAGFPLVNLRQSANSTGIAEWVVAGRNASLR